MTSARPVPVIQVDAIADNPYMPKKPTPTAQDAQRRLSVEARPPLESSWSVQHMAVPVSPTDEFNSTRSSTREAEPVEDLLGVVVVKQAAPVLHAARVVDPRAEEPEPRTVVSRAGSAGPVRRLEGADAFASVHEERAARRQRCVRVLLLVLCLCSWIAIGVLTVLAFVRFGDKAEPELALLPWGLALVPLGLFVLLCWPLCWPRTACEKKTCGCIERLFGCSARDGC